MLSRLCWKEQFYRTHTALRCFNKVIVVWEFSVIMFEIIIILLMENKYLMFFSQPPPIYTFYTERERTNQDGGYDCLDNYLAPLSSEISLMVCYMNDSVSILVGGRRLEWQSLIFLSIFFLHSNAICWVKVHSRARARQVQADYRENNTRRAK